MPKESADIYINALGQVVYTLGLISVRGKEDCARILGCVNQLEQLIRDIQKDVSVNAG